MSPPRPSPLSLRARIDRLRAARLTLVQAAVAAGLAWAIATEVLDQEQPFFAPVAALITLALTGGERRRRAVEVAAGVTVGIAVADTIVYLRRARAIMQLTSSSSCAMAVAVLLGGGVLAVTQAGVSAAFVVTLEQPDGFVFDRTDHAAIGARARAAHQLRRAAARPAAARARRGRPGAARARRDARGHRRGARRARRRGGRRRR